MTIGLLLSSYVFKKGIQSNLEKNHNIKHRMSEKNKQTLYALL